MKTNDLGPTPTATAGLYARGETVPGGSPAPVFEGTVDLTTGRVTGTWDYEPDLPAWAQARADKGLCASIDFWCVTHGVADSKDHAMRQPGQNLD